MFVYIGVKVYWFLLLGHFFFSYHGLLLNGRGFRSKKLNQEGTYAVDTLRAKT
jgi:hypothetical protein